MPTLVVSVSRCEMYNQLFLADRTADTSCILLWLIEQGYEVVAFMADVGQEEVRQLSVSSRHDPI